jgi:hypothetical protein
MSETTYIIISERVGTPGEVFTPAEGVNVDALLAGGFIKTSPGVKKTSKTEEQD